MIIVFNGKNTLITKRVLEFNQQPINRHQLLKKKKSSCLKVLILFQTAFGFS